MTLRIFKMGSLKFLIWFIEENIDDINKTFHSLQLRYGFKKIEIVGVIGDKPLYLNDTKLRNISPDSLHLVKYDHIIIIGSNSNTTSNNMDMKKTLAEKINISANHLIFDFEILNGTFLFPNICLVIIFNHRFDRNLPLLRKIYGGRFSNIRFLVPFYDGDDSDVIAVYESSHQFQGYLIQAYHRLKNIDCTHYLFIGDDLIINTNFNEVNFLSKTTNSCTIQNLNFSICGFSPLNAPDRFRWHWTIGSSRPFYDNSTIWRGSIYDYDEALLKFNNFFQTKYEEYYNEKFFGDPNKPGVTMFGSWNDSNGFFNLVNRFIYENKNSLKIPYPMAWGYSDIFCIKKEYLFEFSRLCGVFSAMNMFVEIAIPTAAVLTFKRENVSFFPSKCISILWGEERVKLENKYNRDFNQLYSDWNKDLYFIHPIKLSGWNIRI